jgi:hypothetical protein
LFIAQIAGAEELKKKPEPTTTIQNVLVTHSNSIQSMNNCNILQDRGETKLKTIQFKLQKNYFYTK